MPRMTLSQRLIDLTRHFMAQWKTEEQQQYPGVMFQSEHDKQPSIIDKDNVGWAYVKPPANGTEPPKRG